MLSPMQMNVAKNTLQRRFMRNVFLGGRGQQGCPLMVVQETGLKECRGRCIVREVSIGRVQDLPEKHSRGRGGCRGTRRRGGECRSYVAEKRERIGEREAVGERKEDR